ATVRLNAAVKDVEYLFLRAKFGIEELVEFFGAPHLDGLANHDGPGSDGKDEEADDDDLGLGCSLPPHIKQLGFICVGTGGCEKNRCVHSDTIEIRRLGREE